MDGFDNVTLVAYSGASINDPTPSVSDDNDVVDVFNSHHVTIQGFTINGGFEGIACARHSLCFLNSNTLQGASDAGILGNRRT